MYVATMYVQMSYLSVRTPCTLVYSTTSLELWSYIMPYLLAMRLPNKTGHFQTLAKVFGPFSHKQYKMAKQFLLMVKHLLVNVSAFYPCTFHFLF